MEVSFLPSNSLTRILKANKVSLKGLHLTAWKAFFPTPVEHLLWKLSALIVVASGCILGVTIPLAREFDLYGMGDNFVLLVLCDFVISVFLKCSEIVYIAARVF